MYSENTYDPEEKYNNSLPHPIVSAAHYWFNYDMCVSFEREREGANFLLYIKKEFMKNYSHLSKEQFAKLHVMIINDLKILQKRNNEMNEIAAYDEIIDFFMTEVSYESMIGL